VFDAFRYGMYSFTKNSHINVSVLSLGAEEEEMDPFDRQLMEAGYVKVSLLN
jgi:hypothetical protein